MTDEQWLWLFANQSLDADERLENMCPECRREVTQEHRCIRCGKKISVVGGGGEFEESFTNESFDMEKYEAMKNRKHTSSSEDELESLKANSNELVEPETDDDGDDIDIELVKQILGQ